MRNRTHCIYGHPFSGDNLYLAPGRLERKCLACQRRRDEHAKPPSEEQILKVTAALNAGQPIVQICRGKIAGKKVGGRIVSFRNLKRYRELNPDFNRFVLSATADSNSKGQQRRLHPDKMRAEIVRNETNDYYKIADMVPRHLPPDVRDDISQSIFLALLDGSLRRDEVKARLHRFITAHNRDANSVD